jgi:hypothetical protein
MDQTVREARDGIVACEGCRRTAFGLRVIDGAKLCDECAEKSERIDRQLATTRSDDPVSCDGCGDPVVFDARVAVVARECGGSILCGDCKPTAHAGARA